MRGFMASVVIATGLGGFAGDGFTPLSISRQRDLVVGAPPQCCINAERPKCESQSSYTTCYLTAIGTVPAQCNVPPATGDEKGYTFLSCSNAYCSTGVAGDKCVTKNEKRNMTGCRPKGTAKKSPHCDAQNKNAPNGKEYVFCEPESYDHGAANGGPVNQIFRESTIKVCSADGGGKTCAAGQPQELCN